MKKRIWKCSIFVFLAVIVMVAAGAGLFYFRALHYADDAERQKDVTALSETAYNLLLLPTYSEGTANGYPFEHFLGVPTYKTTHDFGNLVDINDYLKTALSSRDSIAQVFSFFDPALVSEDFFFSDTLTQKAYQRTLRESIMEHPEVTFLFLLPSYSLDYWCALSDREVEDRLDSYLLFCNEFSGLTNVKIYFFGYLDWLIANPQNYVNLTDCTEEINERMIALTIWNDAYRVNQENMGSCVAALSERIAGEKASPQQVRDFSEYEIVFFGDSIIGNYSGSLSIPGVVNSLTGANTYNCAVGGQSASAAPEEETEALDETLNYFLTGAPSNAFEGKEQFHSEIARFQSGEHDDEKLCFVLAYGLNDYFSGRAISNPLDSYDIYTYSGALRAAVERLQQAYPRAEIILVAPTFVNIFAYGTQKLGDAENVLTDYVDAVLQLAEELELPCLNSYAALEMDESNSIQYLEDGCHLNERGRFAYAQHLIDFLEEQMNKAD